MSRPSWSVEGRVWLFDDSGSKRVLGPGDSPRHNRAAGDSCQPAITPSCRTGGGAAQGETDRKTDRGRGQSAVRLRQALRDGVERRWSRRRIGLGPGHLCIRSRTSCRRPGTWAGCGRSVMPTDVGAGRRRRGVGVGVGRPECGLGEGVAVGVGAGVSPCAGVGEGVGVG